MVLVHLHVEVVNSLTFQSQYCILSLASCEYTCVLAVRLLVRSVVNGFVLEE